MNIIRDQREHTITNNNTATQSLIDILETTNKMIDILEIREPLHGELDLSSIKNMGFGKVTEVIIPEGDVVSIINLPDGIKKFTCSKNLLIDLENLPTSLEELHISDNYIDTLKIDYLKNLKVLQCQSNKLVELNNLPDTLEELHCENNALLEIVSLDGIKNLKVLNVSNTKVYIIYGFQEGITSFKMDNTSDIHFRNALGSPQLKTKSQEKEDEHIKRQKNYVEALDEYFKIKSKYEKDLLKTKRTLFKKQPTKKMAINSAKNAKIPCIKCGNPVGTIFKTVDNKYIAMCGSSQNPCNLDIQIYNGALDIYKEHMDSYSKELQESKQKIICNKLDALFNYVDENESINNFKEELDNYNLLSKFYIELLEKHNDIYNNDIKEELIVKKNKVIYKLNESINNLLQEYKNTGNKEFLKDAVRSQYEQVNSEMRNLSMLKYEIIEMEKQTYFNYDSVRLSLNQNCELDISSKLHPNKIEHILVKKPVKLNKLEHSFLEEPNVIKFIN